jgi:spore coat polysaccharide biosynthesis protein SpsF
MPGLYRPESKISGNANRNGHGHAEFESRFEGEHISQILQYPRYSKVVAIIQMRMGSTRLPGKVLRSIGGYTLLAHIVHRLRQVPALDGIAVATTENQIDDFIVDECKSLDIPCLRGPEEDVLERYIMAAEYCHAGTVVRATGDNPMIDPGSVQRVVEALQAGGFDFVIEHGMPKGCCGEVCTFEALCRAREYAVLPEHREHVTLVMKQDPLRFISCILNAPAEVYQPQINLSIDTEEEYQFVKSVMEAGELHPLSVSVAEVLAGLMPVQCERQLSAV